MDEVYPVWDRWNDLLKLQLDKIFFGTGFGSTGPNAHKGGQDVLAQAVTGVMARKQDENLPLSVYATALCDYTAGMHLVQGVLAALFARERTGVGQKVEVSLYDSMLAMQMQEAAMWLMQKKNLNWAEMPLSGVFETSNGALVIVGAFKKNPLQDICKALEIEDLSFKFPDLVSQRAGKTELQTEFRDALKKNTTEYWLERLEEQDLLCSPVKDLTQALEDPQTENNDMLINLEHPDMGTIKLLGTPVHLSKAPLEKRFAPPKLGEHTDEILKEIGYDEMYIKELHTLRILG